MKLPIANGHGIVADLCHAFQDRLASEPIRDIAGGNSVSGIQQQPIKAQGSPAVLQALGLLFRQLIMQIVGMEKCKHGLGKDVSRQSKID